MVKSINFVCLGQTEFVKELGKIGQSSDITIYDNKKDDRIMTYVIPSSRRTNSSLRSTATR
jgi:aspartate 1-decarboxylase